MSRGKHGRLQADVPAPASCQEPGRSRRSSCPALERASGARRVLACEPAWQTVLSISMNIHAVRPVASTLHPRDLPGDRLNSLVGRPRPLDAATALGMPDDFEPHSPGLIAADTCMALLRLDTLRVEAHWGIAAPLVRDSVTQQWAV